MIYQKRPKKIWSFLLQEKKPSFIFPVINDFRLIHLSISLYNLTDLMKKEINGYHVER